MLFLGLIVKKVNVATTTLLASFEFIIIIVIYYLKNRKNLIKQIYQEGKKFVLKERKVKINFITVSIVIFIVLCIMMTATSLIIYEYSYDGNYYHLPAIIDYIQDEKIDITENTLWNNVYPQNIELISMFFMMFTKSIFMVRMPQIVFAILGVLVVYRLLRSLNYEKSTCVICSILYYTMPFIISQITTTYIDGIVSTLFITLLYFLIKILKERKIKYEILYFMVLSIFMGTKGTCSIYAVIITSIYIIFQIYACFKKQQKIKTLIGKWIIFLLIVLLIGINWMILNIIRFQNPIHPFEFLGIEGMDPNIDIGEENEPQSIRGRNPIVKIFKSWIGLSSSDLIYDNGLKIENLYNTHDSRIGGLGVGWMYFLVPICVVAVLLIIFRKYKINRYELLLILLSTISFIVTPANWWGRYVGFIVLIGFIGLGIVCKTYKDNKWINNAIKILFFIFFGITIILGTRYAYIELVYTVPYQKYSDIDWYINGEESKNIILLEESYYNTQAFVYLKGNNFQNRVDTYYIKSMYPNVKVKNHTIQTYENFTNIIENYKDLDAIIILDYNDKRQNYEFIEKYYMENEVFYNKFTNGEMAIYEKNN